MTSPQPQLPIIHVRGAGELGSACALVLHRSGFPVLLSELASPLAIRRNLCFSDAMVDGWASVEGHRATRAANVKRAAELLKQKNALVLLCDADPPGETITLPIRLDARMLKQEQPDTRSTQTLQVGLGPGFCAGQNCDAVIETMRGPNLGRIYWQGAAAADTGTPGELGGETNKRVMQSPTAGHIHWQCKLLDPVTEGQLLGTVARHEIRSPLNGILRGQIHPATPVSAGMKIADVDPRGSRVPLNLVSDKGLAVGRAVLEAVMHWINISPRK